MAAAAGLRLVSTDSPRPPRRDAATRPRRRSQEEIIEVLNGIRERNPRAGPEVLAETLRAKYPNWVLDDVNWAALSDAVEERLED